MASPATASSSLTAPADREGKFTPVKVVLDEEEVGRAKETLVKDLTFTQVEQHFADPTQFGQKICLVSFIPSKGARPDKDNIYGMMKVRGVYATEDEANERAEFLIRNVDSYHEIFHCHVGRPFPITTSDAFSNEVKSIDIKKKTTEIISEDILTQKRNERQQVEEIKQKEKALLEESNRAQRDEPLDPFEVYITEQVKRAQLIWTYVETQKKMVQMKDSIAKATQAIQDADTEHPDFYEKYKERYYQARKEAGLPEDTSNENSFIKFLGLDLSEALAMGGTVIPPPPRSSPSESSLPSTESESKSVDA